MYRPGNADDLRYVINDAACAGEKLRIRGGGTKDLVGRPLGREKVLDMRGFSGINSYEPAELVLTAGAGTPLHVIASALEAEQQVLGFDPFDHASLFGVEGTATIGGVLAANASGSRRLARGAARDHLLGFTAVSGRGELFVAGGRVVKNVTGYDLPKLMAGSWGRLAALVEVTLKTMPRPQVSTTVRVTGLGVNQSANLMAHALGTSTEIAAARHFPAPLAWHCTGAEHSVTDFLIEGFRESVEARCDHLVRFISDNVGERPVDMIGAETCDWSAIGPNVALPFDQPLWRVSILPSRASACLEALETLGASYWMDWAGGLLWVSVGDKSVRVREIATAFGGHAMLLRAPDEVRERVAAFETSSAPLAALEGRVRRGFDPSGIFETGRF
ncbi:FAD-binding protein [Sphingopyxis sp. YF1]|uniref:FAD-binding protein n=1 Tax=Sphingopyxis sp. YF1 TaxID=2482763 RepID=UPI001F622D24|nr:FAD-binding protein [Sphingopyxis sp. YF1]